MSKNIVVDIAPGRNITFADWHARAVSLNLKLRGKALVGPCPSCAGVDRFSVEERNGKALFQCRGCDPNGRNKGGRDAFRAIMDAAGFDVQSTVANPRKRRRASKGSSIEGAPEGSHEDPFLAKDSAVLQTVLARAKIQLRWNTRSMGVEFREPVLSADLCDWTPINDRIAACMKDDIARQYYVKTERGPRRLKFGQDSWAESVNAILRWHEVDPFEEWLSALPPWDGESVIEEILPDLFGAQNDALTRWVGRYLFIGAVERAFRPGSKLDEMPVLVGGQGIGKSAFLKAILPPELPALFGDSLRFDASPAHQLDAVLGKAIVEISEMAGRSRADIESLKAFISRTNDNGTRRPYAHHTEEQPRRFILCGTTNNENDLPNDVSGLRRFVPIKLGPAIMATEEYVDEIRDRAWSEAMHRFHVIGETARLPREIMPMQAARAEEHRDRDDRIEDAIEGLPAIKQTLGEAMDRLPESLCHISEHRVGKALKNAGWTSARVRREGKLIRLWSPPE